MDDQLTKESSNDDELEVELIKWNSSRKLGFSIAGGVGSQHIRGDNGIYVNSIIEGGMVSWDGRIWVGDLLVAVKQSLNGERFDLTNCTHEEAARTLRWACGGKRVILIVRKTEVNLISWNKNEHLGFSVAGGIDREHIPGDNRIYITNVIEGSAASRDGRISVGDRLLGIKTNFKPKGSLRSEYFFLMNKCTQDAAVDALQKARKGKDVTLIISKEKLPEDYRRLRFDDHPILGKNNSRQDLPQTQPVVRAQNLIKKSLLLPHPSSKANFKETIIRPILTKRKAPTSAKFNDRNVDLLPVNNTRLCNFLNMDPKKPVHIKYISQEENESRQKDLKVKPNSVENSESGRSSGKSALCNNPMNSNNASKYYANGNSPTNCSYDSAMSSMSSEDESRFLDFSNIAKDLPLVGFSPTSPKTRHVRQNSKHIIEPQIEKVKAPVSHFSRPVQGENLKPNINNHMYSTITSNNKKLNRNLKTTRSSSCNRVPDTNKTSAVNRNNSTDHSFTMQNDPKADSLSEYFNERYNITSDDRKIHPNLYSNHFSQHDTIPYFDHINTKHFTKTTTHYLL